MLPPPGLRRDPALQADLEAAFAAKPPGYEARTHLKRDGVPLYVNRLIREASPYLLQHAHNPVDWWPWGDAALAEAKRRDLPVFLSAGYATCHWCHVMEEESFDNIEVAQFLNARFIPVKLDREQRPDIDAIYLTATTLQHHHAGWPNSCWLTPEGKPFHTGTYFPQPQFLALLHAIEKAWIEGRPKLEEFATELSRHVQSVSRRSPEAADLTRAPALAAANLLQAHNRTHGGFSTGTQFPNEGHLLFLIDHWRRSGDRPALDMVILTLDGIAAGGIHDHVGGGFHRYTVDVNWRTPHFEKMLYNQALLMRCFTEGWEITGNPAYARAIERCVGYLQRDMTEADGTFAAADDADSLNAAGEREEGAFYAWTGADLVACLGDAAPAWQARLGLDQPPTLEAGAVIHLLPGAAVNPGIDPVLDRLRHCRDRRPRPFRDAKVIGGWNGLMIRALAEAGLTLGRREWVAMADKALTALLQRLQTPKGLARLSAGGKALEAANLTDHAWIAQAALALADAGQPSWARQLPAMADTILRIFATDGNRLALTQDSPLGPVLEGEDGAVPSGESSALEFLARLHHRQPDPDRDTRALALRDDLSGSMAAMPVIRLTGLCAAQMLDSESGNFRVLAGGAVALYLCRDTLTLAITPGWHLAAEQSSGLAALRITGAEAALQKPRPMPNPLGGDIPGFAGTLAIPLTERGELLTVTVQPCSDSVCLAPVTATFRCLP